MKYIALKIKSLCN